MYLGPCIIVIAEE